MHHHDVSIWIPNPTYYITAESKLNIKLSYLIPYFPSPFSNRNFCPWDGMNTVKSKSSFKLWTWFGGTSPKPPILATPAYSKVKIQTFSRLTVNFMMSFNSHIYKTGNNILLLYNSRSNTLKKWLKNGLYASLSTKKFLFIHLNDM